MTFFCHFKPKWGFFLFFFFYFNHLKRKNRRWTFSKRIRQNFNPSICCGVQIIFHMSCLCISDVPCDETGCQHHFCFFLIWWLPTHPLLLPPCAAAHIKPSTDSRASSCCSYFWMVAWLTQTVNFLKCLCSGLVWSAHRWFSPNQNKSKTSL